MSKFIIVETSLDGIRMDLATSPTLYRAQVVKAALERVASKRYTYKIEEDSTS